MDTNRPQTSDEEGAQPPPLLARSPYRPLSRRRRQAMPAEPRPAVERPAASSVFNASPETIAAALAKGTAAPDGAALTWRRATGGAGGGAGAGEDPRNQ